jgi:hypothetical protein
MAAKKRTQHNEVALRVNLKNTSPVELVDIGQSFEALGELYEAFVHQQGYDRSPGNAKLYLVDIHRGSIIADLKGYLDQASFVLNHLEVLAGFIGNLNDLIEFFRLQRSLKGDDLPTRAEAERIAKFVEPVAKDGGAQVNLTVQGDATVNITNITINSERANAVQNNVRRYLGPPVPESGLFEREVLYLEQMRRGTKTSTGDRGVIEKFSPRPVKLLFMSEEVKAAIIENPENPFQMSYVIDGEVSTARGDPALYKITKVHEAIGPIKKTRRRRRAA